MKNLHVGILIISGEWGGAEETVYQLIKHLTKLHVKISLFINDELKDYYVDIGDIPIYTLGPFKTKIKSGVLYKLYKIRQNLIKLLEKQPVSLIHAQLEGSLFVYAGLFNKFNIPVIFTLHGSEIKAFSEKKNLYEITIYLLLNKMLEKSVAITSPSSWQIKSLERRYKLKTVIIPDGVNTKEFKPIIVKKEKNVILHIGRFIRWKGIAELIRVAKELPQYEFWFAGWGPLASLMTLPNTKNLGFKKRDELLELYNKATLCVFPSYYEPFGIVGLEAMACGRPVIATKKGFSEFLEYNKEGIIIEPENPQQLKGSIIKLMNNPQLRRKLGKNARKKALKYDWRKIIKKYHLLYKDAVTK